MKPFHTIPVSTTSEPSCTHWYGMLTNCQSSLHRRSTLNADIILSPYLLLMRLVPVNPVASCDSSHDKKSSEMNAGKAFLALVDFIALRINDVSRTGVKVIPNTAAMALAMSHWVVYRMLYWAVCEDLTCSDAAGMFHVKHARNYVVCGIVRNCKSELLLFRLLPKVNVDWYDISSRVRCYFVTGWNVISSRVGILLRHGFQYYIVTGWNVTSSRVGIFLRHGFQYYLVTVLLRHELECYIVTGWDDTSSRVTWYFVTGWNIISSRVEILHRHESDVPSSRVRCYIVTGWDTGRLLPHHGSNVTSSRVRCYVITSDDITSSRVWMLPRHGSNVTSSRVRCYLVICQMLFYHGLGYYIVTGWDVTSSRVRCYLVTGQMLPRHGLDVTSSRIRCYIVTGWDVTSSRICYIVTGWDVTSSRVRCYLITCQMLPRHGSDVTSSRVRCYLEVVE